MIFFTDYLSHLLLSGQSDSFSKWDKKLFIQITYFSFKWTQIQIFNSHSNKFLGCICHGCCNGELRCTHKNLPQGLFWVCFFIQTAAYAQVCILGNVWCVNFIFLQCLNKLVWFILHLLSDCFIFYTLPTQDTSTATYWCQRWPQNFEKHSN